MAAKLTPQSPQAAPQSFWQLISGVAHDLDLMLQDLFPDSIPSPLREEYGLTNEFALDEAFANHPTLLEQFMRGAGGEATSGPHSVEQDSSGEYRSSKSLQPDSSSPASDSYGGRTTTPTPTSSPSPPPPAPPPRTALHYTDYPANNLHCMASTASGDNIQGTMVSSSSVSSVQETSDGDSSHTSSSFAPCDIGLLERLIRTHPIWFLPGIGRAGAVHLLQGKDVGSFIVRQSSKPNTMALSVRLPENKGPYVEHYLIETVGDAQLRLEGSDNNFHAIPMLVAHYCQCCDELPVQLALPRPLAQASSRQELSSLALLGQDFWLSSLVHSPSSSSPPSELPHSSPVNTAQHSTFKPQNETGKRSGPSPPSTLALNSQNLPAQDANIPAQSPDVSSPPPPVAPKFKNRGAPPPPPPRSFVTTRSPSCANIGPTSPDADASSSPDSPASNGFGNRKSCPDVEKLIDKAKKKSEDADKKNDKKISKVAHYKQSNIVDLPTAYYRSSLADKISDYEDIWANSVAKEKKPNFLSFQSALHKADDSYLDALKRKNYELFTQRQCDEIVLTKLKYTYTQGTQTEVPGAKSVQITSLEMIQSEFSDFSQDSDMKIGNQGSANFDDVSYAPNGEENFSSPFYSEPVDSLPFDIHGGQSAVHNGLPQRLFNHRFSDPNLHWPQNIICKRVDASEDERFGSLSSSVDNIKGLGPSPQFRRHKNFGMNTDWVSELHQRISKHSFLKKDTETQVSNPDLHMESPHVPSPAKDTPQNTSWPLDSSWEWQAHDEEDGDTTDDGCEDVPPPAIDSKFPLHIENEQRESCYSDSTTVKDLIALRSPDLAVPEIRPLTKTNVMRVSEYDNIGSYQESSKDVPKLETLDSVDDTATEFSEPWDSFRWEKLLRLVIPETDILGDDDDVRQKEKEQNHVVSIDNKKQEVSEVKDPLAVKYDDSESVSTVSGFSDMLSNGVDNTSVSQYPTLSLERERNKSFQERLEPLLAAQRVIAMRNKGTSKVDENIKQYIFRLAEERNNTFAMSIENFIQCTKESNEANPAVVMRNIRQFMNGMRNYLVKHGEGQFEQLVQDERSKLRQDEFSNIDAIIEGALHELVIKPLKSYIYQLFVNEYTRNGSLKLLSDNIKFARTKTPEELGVPPDFRPPEGASLEVVHHFLNCLQQAYSPTKKLENLLVAISTIYNSVLQDKLAHSKEHISLGAEDFLPIFIWVLVQCGLIAAEIEADYMWGLLHPSVMFGEGGYYLTTLSSAVHVLKNLQACSPESPQHAQMFDQLNSIENGGNKTDLSSPKAQGSKTVSPEPRLPCIADLQGFMKIMIPDELTGSIISKTLPVRPNMTTKEVVKMIAHKFNVTNPQDYSLYKLVKGEETLLGDNECPQTLKADLLAKGINCVFTYKRCDAKFIWPVMDCS